MATKKAPAKSAAKKSTTTKSTSARKATAKKSSSSKTPAKKTAASKSAARKTPAKKTAARKYSTSAGSQVATEMHEMHEGKLKIGRSGTKVTNPRQAIAIGLSEARKKGAKVPPKPNPK
ncbi:MAG: hypothetical protein HIU91_04640 [Acidobacteria bacterium]|nr:hypothetical protein [Acidobacteriota bacterium]